jgi:hypothetical protein
MPNISKKTAYDVKEASDQSLSKSARKHYAENAQAGSKDDSPMSKYGSHSPMNMGGSWMSKHSGQSKFGSPLNQGTISVYPDRLNKKGQTQTEVLNNASKPLQDYAEQHSNTIFSSQDRLDKSKMKIKKLQNRYNKVKDSVGRANKTMNLRFDAINKQRTKLNKQQSDILSGNY